MRTSPMKYPYLFVQERSFCMHTELPLVHEQWSNTFVRLVSRGDVKFAIWTLEKNPWYRDSTRSFSICGSRSIWNRATLSIGVIVFDVVWAQWIQQLSQTLLRQQFSKNLDLMSGGRRMGISSRR